LPNQHGSRIATAPVDDSMGTLGDRVDRFERAVIVAEIKKHNGHITNTAKALGLERSHLYKKCEQLGIDLRQTRKQD
jgi:two-component system nitrogen regulation response regulator NtrX